MADNFFTKHIDCNENWQDGYINGYIVGREKPQQLQVAKSEGSDRFVKLIERELSILEERKPVYKYTISVLKQLLHEISLLPPINPKSNG